MFKIFGLFLYLIICLECLGQKTFVCVSNNNEEAIAMTIKKFNNVTVLFPNIFEGFEEQIDTMSNIQTMSSETFGNRSFILDRRWENLPIIKNETLKISGKTIGFSVFLVKNQANLEINYDESKKSNLIFNISDSENLENCTKTGQKYYFQIPRTDWIHFQILNNSSILTVCYKNFKCNIEGNFENTTFKVDDNLWKQHNYSMTKISTTVNLEVNETKKGFLNFFAASNRNGTEIFNIFNQSEKREIGTTWKFLNFTYENKTSFGVFNQKDNDTLEVYVTNLTLTKSTVTRIVNYTSKENEEVKCNFIQNEKIQSSSDYHNCEIDESKYCPNVKNCEICCKGICYNLKSKIVAKFIIFHALIAGIILLLSVCISGVIYWKFFCKKNNGEKVEKPPTYQDFNPNLVEMSEISSNENRNRNRNNSENDPLFSSLPENRKRMNSENDPLYSSLTEKREVLNDMYQSSEDILNSEKDIEEDIFGYIGGKKPIQNTFNNQQPKNEIYFSRAKLNTDTIIENDLYSSLQNNLNSANSVQKVDYKKNIKFDAEKKNKKFK